MIEVIFMAGALLIANNYINNGLYPRRVFSSSSAFLIGNWFFIVFNALLTTTGHAEKWGERLLDDASLYTISSVVVVVGIIFFYARGYFFFKT